MLLASSPCSKFIITKEAPEYAVALSVVPNCLNVKVVDSLAVDAIVGKAQKLCGVVELGGQGSTWIRIGTKVGPITFVCATRRSCDLSGARAGVTFEERIILAFDTEERTRFAVIRMLAG